MTGYSFGFLMSIKEQKNCSIISPKGKTSLHLLHPAPSQPQAIALGKQPQFTAIRYTQNSNLYNLI